MYSNVSDCAVTGSLGKVGTGWVRVDPGVRWVSSNLITYGNGPSSPKLSGAVVDGGTLFLLARYLTTSGGMRVGRSASIAQPSVTWIASLNFGWGSFAQGAPTATNTSTFGTPRPPTARPTASPSPASRKVASPTRPPGRCSPAARQPPPGCRGRTVPRAGLS